MIYVFDTSAFRELQHFYPTVFTSIWQGLDQLTASEKIISTREVWNELERQNISEDVLNWTKRNKQIFLTPTPDELRVVADILRIPHFQTLIGQRQRLKGEPVADPFVIACAKIREGIVVTQERLKPNAAKIPNVCEHLKIGCINLERLMQQEGWSF